MDAVGAGSEGDFSRDSPGMVAVRSLVSGASIYAPFAFAKGFLMLVLLLVTGQGFLPGLWLG
jgi:hypothetical protein